MQPKVSCCMPYYWVSLYSGTVLLIVSRRHRVSHDVVTVPATTLSDGPDSCWSNASIHLPTPGLARFSPGQIYSSLKDLVPVCCKPLPSRKYVDPPHIKEYAVYRHFARPSLSASALVFKYFSSENLPGNIGAEPSSEKLHAAIGLAANYFIHVVPWQQPPWQAPHWSTWRWSFCGSGFGTPTLPKQILFRSPQCFPRWPGIPPQWSWWGVGGPPTQKRLWLTNLTSFVPLFVAKSSCKSLPN